MIDTVLDVLTVYGGIWTLMSVAAVVLLFRAFTRDEPPLEDDPEGELVPVDFRNGNHGKAA